MSYLVNDIFYTLQGEGYWSGRPAVFCRFARCNLWTGREEDRHRAVCQFCDTDFLRGERMTVDQITEQVDSLWPKAYPFIVLTGGEPLLQADSTLIAELHSTLDAEIAIETNGTIATDLDLDWICVSPKANAPLKQQCGNELKVVYPQATDPRTYEDLDFEYFWISPMDGPNLAENTQGAIDFVLSNPKWRLNIQTHKVIGVK